MEGLGTASVTKSSKCLSLERLLCVAHPEEFVFFRSNRVCLCELLLKRGVVWGIIGKSYRVVLRVYY